MKQHNKMMQHSQWTRLYLRTAVALALLAGVALQVHAQASAIPSAQSAPETQGDSRGRKLLDQMVVALGGDAWLNRKDWTEIGRGSTFYKGTANPYVTEFEEYYRLQPFGERVVIVSKNANPITELIGVPMSKAKRDNATVWTPENGYEINFHGKVELPKNDVTDYQVRRLHSLEVVVKDWLHQPGVLVTYEGTDMVDRRLADKISILTATNDAVVLELDETTHLPLSRSFESRNATYHDFDSYMDKYDDYHPIQGIMTSLTLTRYKNGDMVGQRYLTKVAYNVGLAPDLFNPDRPLVEKISKH